MTMTDEKQKKPLVGVAMFTYNYGKYIDEAILSLKQQTFQDFEIYLSDDGSNDGFTPQKLKDLNYDKVAKKLLYTDNIGVAKRAQQLYKMINNKYLFVLCADDKVAPEFLEKTVKFLDEHPKYGAVSTDILQYKDDFEGEPLSIFHYDEKKMGFPEMLVRCYCLGSSLMRNEALRQVDFSGGFTRYQDWDRYVSMLEAGWKLGNVAEPLFMYRLHGDSLSHTSTKEIGMEVFEKMLKKHAKSYEKYYEKVMKGLYYNWAELQEGKDWLEKQYNNHLKELERLNNEVNRLNEELSGIKGKWKKVGRKIKNKLRGKNNEKTN